MERMRGRPGRIAVLAALLLLLGSLFGCQDLDLIATIRELKFPFVPRFTSTLGPPGATVQVLAVSGSTVYAGCLGGGVYKSTNSGLSWSAVGSFLPHDVRSLATDGTYLYAGIGDGISSPNDGVYRIALSGGSWQSYGIAETVWALLINGGYVYAALNIGVMRIPTAGGSWEDVSSGLGAGRMYCLITGLSGAPWAGSQDGAFSFDGSTWSEIGNANRAWSMACDGTYVYITSDDAGVQYSTGGAWATYGTGFTSTRNPCVITAGGYLYAGDNANGVFQCDTVPFTPLNAWVEVGPGTDDIGTADERALAAVGSTLLAGTYVGPGLYTHAIPGTSGAWTKAGSGIYSSTVYDLATDGTNLFAGTDRGVFARPIAGGFWADFGTSGPTDTVYDLVIEGIYLYAGGTSLVKRVPLAGGSWASFGTGLPEGARSLHSDGTYLYAGTWTGSVLRVSLGGGAWADWGTSAQNGNGANQFFEDSATLFKASNNGVFYKGLGGTNWTLLGTSVLGFYSLASDGTYLFGGTYSSGVQRIPLAGGSDWAALGSGLPASAIWALQVVGDRLVAAVEADGLYSVPLTGGSWAPYGAGLFDGSTVGAFLLDGQTLYAGTGEFATGGSGAWQATVE